MGGWFSVTSSSEEGDEEQPGNSDRFVQLPQQGIILYTQENVDSFLAQFEELRCNSFQEIVTQLYNKDLPANKHNFCQFWSEAAVRFNSNPSKYRTALKQLGGQDFPNECHMALISYTLGNISDSVYSKFNEECRHVCAGAKKLRNIANLSFFFLLMYVLENVAESEASQYTLLYRGCKSKGLNWDRGNLIGFGLFTSTTESMGTALDFAGQSGTVFVISNRNKVPAKCISLATHSKFSYEKEHLLSPFQLYSVISIEQNYARQMVYVNLC